MNTRILVAYASKHGATAEIAEKVGQILRDANLITDVRPVSTIDDLSIYSAVVIGSAVYMGQWRKEAARFLKHFADDLAKLPIWVFSTGPTNEGDPVELLEGWTFPKNLQPTLDSIRPRDIKVFHGVLDADQLSFSERLIIKGVKAPMGDFRDWDMINAWALDIIDAIQRDILERQ